MDEAVDDLRRVVGDGGRRVRDVKSAVVPVMSQIGFNEQDRSMPILCSQFACGYG